MLAAELMLTGNLDVRQLGGWLRAPSSISVSFPLTLNLLLPLLVMISRTLGPEVGGSIGLMFYLANVCGCAVSLLGLVESILDVFGAGLCSPQAGGGCWASQNLGLWSHVSQDAHGQPSACLCPQGTYCPQACPTCSALATCGQG